MKTYKIIFTGRENGALGITYCTSVTVRAENEEDAVLKLYDKYEHILVASIGELAADEE